MAISTKSYKTEDFPVPNEWVFEKFLNLHEKLVGQSVSIKSIFNKADKNPSMIIYLHNNGKYKFKDFSSGLNGDAVDLIKLLYNLKSRNEAFAKTLEFYNSDDHTAYENNIPILKIEKEIINVENRPWNVDDQEYWTAYSIGSIELETYNIKPIKSYTFRMTQGENSQEMTFSKKHCYGYYTKNGVLFKIYNPMDKKTKFIKVKKYIQGHDQLQYKGQWLIILASMKDLIAFRLLRFPNIECVAPDSENTIINAQQMAYYKSKYKFISVLFDNDVAGKNSALKYQQIYGLPYTEFTVEKDIAECVKEHGITNTRLFLKDKLIETKNGKLKKD